MLCHQRKHIWQHQPHLHRLKRIWRLHRLHHHGIQNTSIMIHQLCRQYCPDKLLPMMENAGRAICYYAEFGIVSSSASDLHT